MIQGIIPRRNLKFSRKLTRRLKLISNELNKDVYEIVKSWDSIFNLNCPIKSDWSSRPSNEN